MEQERPRQEENIKKLTGKCSYKIKLYNNTPSHTIVNAVSYISYRPMFLQFFLWTHLCLHPSILAEKEACYIQYARFMCFNSTYACSWGMLWMPWNNFEILKFLLFPIFRLYLIKVITEMHCVHCNIRGRALNIDSVCFYISNLEL
jgi:hypothetical protein